VISLIQKQVRASHSYFECLNVLRVNFLKVCYEMLRTIVRSIFYGCFHFDLQSYLSYLSEFVLLEIFRWLSAVIFR